MRQPVFMLPVCCLAKKARVSLSSSLPLQMLADIRPNEEHAKEHIERSPVTTMAHIVPDMSEHEVGLLSRQKHICSAHYACRHAVQLVQCLSHIVPQM